MIREQSGGSYYYSGHSTVAEIEIHHPPGTAGGTETRGRWKKRIQCCGYFAPGVPSFAKAAEGEPWPKFPQPFLEEDGEGEEKC